MRALVAAEERALSRTVESQCVRHVALRFTLF
jgi:hypothetical protein